MILTHCIHCESNGMPRSGLLHVFIEIYRDNCLFRRATIMNNEITK